MNCLDDNCQQKFFFYFEGNNEDFARFAWPINHSNVVLVYRGVVALYEIVLLLTGPYLFVTFYKLSVRDAWKLFLYFDTWQNVVATMYFIVAFLSQLYAINLRRKSQVVPVTLATVNRKDSSENERPWRSSATVSELKQSEEIIATPRKHLTSLDIETNALHSSTSFCHACPESTSLSWYNKTRWVLLNICFNVSLSLIWIFVFLIVSKRQDVVFYYTHYHRFVITFVLLVIEMFLVSHPMYVQHVWFAELFALSYFTFAAVYLLNGGTDHYGKNNIAVILNFEQQPMRTVAYFLILIFLALPTGQCFAVLVVYIRKKLIMRIYKIAEESDEGTIQNREEYDAEEGADNYSLYDREFERKITMMASKSKRSSRSSKASRQSSNKPPSVKSPTSSKIIKRATRKSLKSLKSNKLPSGKLTSLKTSRSGRGRKGLSAFPRSKT